MNLKIRNANIHDLDQIAEIHVSCWKTAYSHILEPDYLNKLSFERSLSRNLLNLKKLSPEEFFIVAEDPKTGILGFAIGGPQRDKDFSETGEIACLYIHTEYQNLGVGTALLNEGFSNLKKSNLTSVLIWAFLNNKQKDFYSKNGGKSKYIKHHIIDQKPYLVEGWKWELMDERIQ